MPLVLKSRHICLGLFVRDVLQCTCFVDARKISTMMCLIHARHQHFEIIICITVYFHFCINHVLVVEWKKTDYKQLGHRQFVFGGTLYLGCHHSSAMPLTTLIHLKLICTLSTDVTQTFNITLITDTTVSTEIMPRNIKNISKYVPQSCVYDQLFLFA